MKKVIINADDYGLLPSVNQAILDTYKQGNLSSVTVFTNMPGWDDSLHRLKDFPELATGLHFNLTEGNPLSNCSTLVDADASFWDKHQLAKGLWLNKIDPAEITSEFKAQLEKFEKAGLSPSHVDSHQHVHMHPGVFHAISPIIKERKLPLRKVDPPIDISLLWSNPMRYLKRHYFHHQSIRLFNRSGVLHNQKLVSIHDFPAKKQVDKSNYLQILDYIDDKGVSEIMIHPYIMDEEFRTFYRKNLDAFMPFFSKCAEEYEVLSSGPVFDKPEVELISYRDL